MIDERLVRSDEQKLCDDAPTGRPYTELEALYSMSVDYDNGRRVSVAGYTKLWGWGSQGKVRRFLKKVGGKIGYQGSKHDAQGGELIVEPTANLLSKNGKPKLIDSRALRSKAANLQRRNGEQTEKQAATTCKDLIGCRNPCPQGKVRVQRLCRLNIPA